MTTTNKRPDWWEWLRRSPYVRREGRYGYVLAVGFLTALCVMIPFMVYDKGYFLLYGDFNVQQYPFYMHVHDALHKGEFGWDFKTDLGVNLIGSYSFYNLGSPFFLATLLLPSGAVPYLIGPLLALKIGCCATTGYAYIRRFTRYDEFAVMGGMMYAFSGFSVFNMFFNHFHEPMVFFPLMLIALEEFMEHDRRGWFAVTVAVNAFVNYYFFVAEACFVAIYFFVRLAGSKKWRLTPRKFGTLAFETVLGFAMAGVMVLPSVWEVAQNPRTEQKLYGWNALVYAKPQRYLNILEAFFFPPDLPARPNFTPDSNTKWGSVAACLPLFGMTGVIAWLQGRKGHWLRRMIIICFFMAFIPILNASFQLLSATYYARWFFLFTLMNALATVMALSNSDMNWDRAVKWAAGITAAIAFGIGFMVKTLPDEEKEIPLEFGLMEYRDRFWIYVAIAMLSLMMTAMLLKLLREKDRMRVYSLGMAGIVTVYAATCIIFIGQGKTLSYDSRDYIIPYALSRGENIHLPGLKKAQYRVDFYKDMDNMGMFWDTSCIQAFHSIVPPSVMDFYESVGVERGVGSRPGTDVYAIRSLLSVKYLFDNAEKGEFRQKTVVDGQIRETRMPGWSYLKTEGGYDVWQNDGYIPYGFTYDYYISQKNMEEAFATGDHASLMLRALVLSSPKQEQRLSDILTPLPNNMTAFHESSYLSDCADRARECCYDFRTDREGFSASVDLSRKNAVFFSIPWQEGWQAYVNGKRVRIEKVNVGFMAVVCPEGHSDIRFVYHTPLLRLGIWVTVTALAAFGVYAVVFAYDPERGRVVWLVRLSRWIRQRRKGAA
ncbi:MAG: YfhO family protein [Clostridia bacterium]|nr:YfhO family protein [Clostridia bacterium]